MVRWARPLIASLVVCLPALGAGDDPLARLPAIRNDLASAEFSVREAAQKELEKISPSQVDLLRTMSKSEDDPEVKARLDARVEAMDIYNLLHPTPLSLKCKDANLIFVTDALNQQLGDAAIQPRAGVPGTFTVDITARPFGEIIEELSRQQPIFVGSTSVLGPQGTSMRLALQAAPANMLTPVKAADSFALMVQTAGNPAGGANWTLGLAVACDPRIRVSQYASALSIEKMTDQDGRSLLAALQPRVTTMTTTALPAPYFTSAASFTGVAGLTKISLLRVKLHFAVMTSEQKYSYDLAKLPETPIETSRGPMTFEKMNGETILHLPGPEVAPAAGAASRPTLIQLVGANSVTTFNVSSPMTSINLAAYLKNVGNGGTITISWPESSKECELPVELKDLELPPPAPVVPAGVPGAVLLR